jgi:hypothetical protein
LVYVMKVIYGSPHSVIASVLSHWFLAENQTRIGAMLRYESPRGVHGSKRKTAKQTEDKRPYTEAEPVKLFSGTPQYPGLAHLMALGL